MRKLLVVSLLFFLLIGNVSAFFPYFSFPPPPPESFRSVFGDLNVTGNLRVNGDANFNVLQANAIFSRFQVNVTEIDLNVVNDANFQGSVGIAENLFASNIYNKEEVDALIGGADFDLFLFDAASADIVGYRTLQSLPSSGVEQSLTQTVSGTGFAFEQFANNESDVNIGGLSEGLYELHIHASAVTLGKLDAVIFWEFYRREPDGTEFLIGTSESSPTLTSNQTEYNLHLNNPVEVMTDGNRFVVKVLVDTSGAGGNPDVTIFYEGLTFSRAEILTAFPIIVVPVLPDTTLDTNSVAESNWLGTPHIATADWNFASIGITGGIYGSGYLLSGFNQIQCDTCFSRPSGVALGDSSTANGLFGSVAIGISANASSILSSVAIGNSVTASGQDSVSIGNFTNASETDSVAIGRSTTASGTQSIAIGSSTIASGNASIAMGEGTIASGNNGSVAMGFATQAVGGSSFAVGRNTYAFGDESFTGGVFTVAFGDGSVSIGRATTIGRLEAKGEGAVAMGYADVNTLAGDEEADRGAIALGYNVQALGEATIVLGKDLVCSKPNQVCVNDLNAVGDSNFSSIGFVGGLFGTLASFTGDVNTVNVQTSKTFYSGISLIDFNGTDLIISG